MVYQDPSRDCKLFDWVDPKLPCKWYIDLIWGLRNGENVEQIEEAAFMEVPNGVQGQGQGGVGVWGFLKIFLLGFLFGLLFKLL